MAVWARLWDVPRLEFWESIGSTNDRARELASSGAPSYTVVLAEEQRRGRGRAGRIWHSPSGSGLWMSVVVNGLGRPGPLTPILTGLAVCRAMETIGPGLRPTIKWPNDVFLGDRKVCGILCESVGTTVVIGIGVNTRAGRVPPEISGVATSIEEHLGTAPSRSRLAGRIIREVRRIVSDEEDRLRSELRAEIAARDRLMGSAVEVVGGVTGICEGIDDRGVLLVRTNGEGRPTVHRVTAGTVRQVGPSREEDPDG